MSAGAARDEATMRRNDWAWTGAVATLAALGTLATLATSPAMAAMPKTIGLEGYMHTGAGPAVDGKYAVQFALYGGAQAATPFWSETVDALEVKGGTFVHALGSKNALDQAALAATPEVWLAAKIGTDPELPRAQLHAVAFALRAAVAEVALGLSCTGCLKSSALQWDGDLDLTGFSLKAASVNAKTINGQSVVAQEFLGDGSKLTGIALPSGACPSGQAVTGIAANGALVCKKLTADVPTGSLEEVSNGALSNEFQELVAAPSKKVPIPDNTGLEGLSTITVPDVGTAKSITIAIDVESSDLSKVAIVLLPPDDKKVGYTVCDPCGKTGEKVLKATIPSQLPLQVGDLAAWIGQNPKGLWNLKVKDTGYCIPQLPGNNKICDVNAGTDGWIHDWSIQVTTVSDKDVAVKGQLIGYGGVRVGGTSAPCTAKLAGSLRYLDGKGLELCDGKAWSSLSGSKAPPHYVGTCQSNGSSSTYTFCLSQQLANTMDGRITVTTTNSGSASDFNVGRVLVNTPGTYRFSFNRHSRGSSCQWWMYKSGNQVGYGYQTDSYTTVYFNDSASRILEMKQNDSFNIKFNCNNTAWYATHTTLEVEYLGE